MIHFLAAIVGGLSALARKCPACGRTQLVPLSKKHRGVPCKFCGKGIPPPGPAPSK